MLLGGARHRVEFVICAVGWLRVSCFASWFKGCGALSCFSCSPTLSVMELLVGSFFDQVGSV